MEYLSDGKSFSQAQATKMNLFGGAFAMVAPMPADRVRKTQVFRTEKAFRSWVTDSPIAESIAKIDAGVAAAEHFKTTDLTHAMARQKLLSDRMIADVDALAARLGLDPLSSEFLEIAQKGVSILEPPVLHSATLYADSSASSGGDRVIILNNVPYFTLPLNLNNRVSAVSIPLLGGILTLWSRTWFQGTRKVVPRGPAFIRMADIGFDNTAASAYLV